MKKKVHQKGVYPVIFEVMKMSKLSGVKYLTNFYLHTNPPPPSLPPQLSIVLHMKGSDP